MKKVVVLFLVVCMFVATLAGCGTDTSVPSQGDKPQTDTNAQQPVTPEENQAKTEQENTEVAVGTVLDAPEVLFDANADELYVCFTYPGDTAEETASMEIAVDQVTADTYLIYTTDGLLKNHELVYEVSDAGVTKYYKDAFMGAFALETEATQQQLEMEKNKMLSLLSYFMMQSSDYAGFRYRKSDAKVAVLTGEVYVYDVIENNEYAGQVCIDKATGVMVSFKDAEGASLFNVLNFKVSDVEIPAYK